jgi:hypothetical protein
VVDSSELIYDTGTDDVTTEELLPRIPDPPPPSSPESEEPARPCAPVNDSKVTDGCMLSRTLKRGSARSVLSTPVRMSRRRWPFRVIQVRSCSRAPIGSLNTRSGGTRPEVSSIVERYTAHDPAAHSTMSRHIKTRTAPATFEFRLWLALA